MAGNDRMPVEAALQTMADLRDQRQVFITNQGSARLWPRISQQPGDFNYNPSTMGGVVPLALGLALARPDLEVVVISGDGSLLMSLGCLVTVIDSGVCNLSVVLLNNGIYEVTGGQAVPAAEPALDYAGMARAIGFASVGRYGQVGHWRAEARDMLCRAGPRFIVLDVNRLGVDCLADASEPLREQLARFQTFLCAS